MFFQFVSLTIPSFGPILDLSGACKVLPVLIFPIIFYFYLNAAGNMRDIAVNRKSLGNGTDKVTNEEAEYPLPTFKQMLQYNEKR
jgi:hypothetical protein